MKNKLKQFLIITSSVLMMGQAYAQKKPSKKPAGIKEISSKDYKTFHVSDNITMYAVTFNNQYNMKVAGHLFIPDNLDQNKKHAAIIVGHPMGAVDLYDKTDLIPFDKLDTFFKENLK